MFTEKEVHKIVESGVRRKEIRKYLQELLYDTAKEKKCYCTWIFDSFLFNEEDGFKFTIEVTSEDEKYQAQKTFSVGYEWEKEKAIMKEVVLYLIDQLQIQQEK